MIIKIPKSTWVQKGKNKWVLKEKALIAEICCPTQRRTRKGGGEYFEKVKIKIISTEIGPDDLFCLYSSENNCSNEECILHAKWGDP